MTRKTMIDYSHDIDFDKYKTFVLSYYKDDSSYGNFEHHFVRPTTATYDEIVDTTKFRSYTLEGAVLSFENETSLAEIILESTVRGISIDFIDIYVKNLDAKSSWQNDKWKLSQVIDTHKEDVTKCLDKVEAKRYYIALNTSKTSTLRYLVIDRFAQDGKIDFLKGKYDKNAAVAGFKDYDKAKDFCTSINNY